MLVHMYMMNINNKDFYALLDLMIREFQTASRVVLELALPSKMIQRGSESNANKVLAQEGNCSVNLAS
jgi:hypothetical protein